MLNKISDGVIDAHLNTGSKWVCVIETINCTSDCLGDVNLTPQATINQHASLIRFRLDANKN